MTTEMSRQPTCLLIACLAVSAVCFSLADGAEKGIKYKPHSLELPPPPFEGITTKDVLADFNLKQFRVISDKCSFCPANGLHQWHCFPKNYTGTATIKSYEGKDDFVGLRLQISGFLKSTPGNTPENMPEVIAAMAEDAKVLRRDAAAKERLAVHLREYVRPIAYSEKGIRRPNGTVVTEDTHVFDDLRIHIKNENQGTVAITELEFSVAEKRTWSDKSGMFQIDATYISHTPTEATLIKDDGKQIKVPLKKLCDVDLKFLAERGGNAEESADSRGKTKTAGRSKGRQ